MSSDSAIHVRGLRKAYGGQVAVDGVDLDVAPGEVYALLGPNGAGKTTTVEILEGHRVADSGVVRVLGAPPGHTRAQVGIVLQDTKDALDLTVAEMVGHFAGYYQIGRAHV